MAKFHFVEDYERHVQTLKKNYPIDQAMSLAVGGDFDRVGQIFLGIAIYGGLRTGMSIIDFGCGSGRAAKAFSQHIQVDYLGIDIIEDLLDYARSICPPNYRFALNHELKIPAPTASTDMVIAFSVFTHLLHEETYLYLEDIYRVLKPGGILIFSFLEFSMPSHWAVFQSTVDQQRNSTSPHLNMFIERSQIAVWAQHLGFVVKEYINGDQATPFSVMLGQAVAILKVPENG